VIMVSMPIILSEYFRAGTGRDYQVGFLAKLQLARRMARNRKKITTSSHFLEHLVMATQLLKIPASVKGCVVECGSFKGGSAANLSLVCALCKRQLEIFDSFEGLPTPLGTDNKHAIVNEHEVHTYAKGSLCGTLEEVRANISKNGAASACNFNAGYFEQTLPRFQGKCVLIFLDVDLVESLKTCCRYLWPLLQEGCYLFTHEAHHSEIAALFFEEQWWQSNIGCKAPGLIGAGTGLGLLPSSGGFSSALGYAIKNPSIASFEVSPQIGILS
jgi:macrocin-O-methyltransferase TylF-like protien